MQRESRIYEKKGFSKYPRLILFLQYERVKKLKGKNRQQAPTIFFLSRTFQSSPNSTDLKISDSML